MSSPRTFLSSRFSRIISVAGGADDASSRQRVFARTDTWRERERDFTPKKCARKNISREWCDGGVAKDVSHFSYLRYVLDRFSDATNETCGRVLDARERFRAFRRRKKILPQEGSVGKEFFSLEFLSFSRPFSLCLSSEHILRVFRTLCAAEKNRDVTCLSSSFY